MNKYIKILFIAFSLPSLLFSQDFDGQRLAERDIQGTARYVAMGGAFSALGGDVSAVNDNPAALGIFRRGELSVTADVRLDNVTTDGVFNGQDRRMTLPQLSWVMSFGSADKQTGVIFNNIIIQYHRLKTYNRHSVFNPTLYTSQTDLMAELSNGASEEMMQGSSGWTNKEIGWLTKAGYEGYLINPMAGNQWQSVYNTGEQVKTELEIYDGGVENEFTAGWGMNYSNRLYFGLTANVRSLNYSRQTQHTEHFLSGTTYQMLSAVAALGWGLNAAIGTIYRPTDYLRFGLSISTPTVMYIDFENYTEIKSNANSLDGKYVEINSPRNHYSQKLYEPMRLTAGIAFQIGYKALISAEYDFDCKTSSQLYSTHTLKAGAEVSINNHWFLRAGYACQSAFSKKEWHYYPHFADTRTDTDYQNNRMVHYFNAGAGWHNKSWIVDIAYQCRWQNENEYAYYKSSPMSLDALTHRIVLTFGWNYRL